MFSNLLSQLVITQHGIAGDGGVPKLAVMEAVITQDSVDRIAQIIGTVKEAVGKLLRRGIIVRGPAFFLHLLAHRLRIHG